MQQPLGSFRGDVCLLRRPALLTILIRSGLQAKCCYLVSDPSSTTCSRTTAWKCVLNTQQTGLLRSYDPAAFVALSSDLRLPMASIRLRLQEQIHEDYGMTSPFETTCKHHMCSIISLADDEDHRLPVIGVALLGIRWVAGEFRQGVTSGAQLAVGIQVQWTEVTWRISC